ncbi:hypothetical protein [Streptomyces hoynatensis]|nr:hypothetical protein [Streptomyces hoynatensis]
MEQFQFLAALAIGRLPADSGSGPPPAPAGHEADRAASMGKAGAGARGPARRARRGRPRFRRGARGTAPATAG